jgi:ectoine hydroxylase-related dioxygenase (phytanoyl-CoA dioxygenase family)
MATLSQHDVDFYNTNGYFLYHHQLFSAEKLDCLAAIFEEHLAEKGDKLSDELDTPHFRDPRLLEFLLSEEVLDLVEPITGPDIALWSSHFICKDPYTGRKTPWHEDSAYWKDRLDKHERIVTVWLALDRSSDANGCMKVIPGSQSNGFSEYHQVDSSTNTFVSEINEVDEAKAVPFELERGECSLHDARIIHGASANTSPYRRCGYTMRYMTTGNKVLGDSGINRGHQIWLARGKDLAGNVYANA